MKFCTLKHANVDDPISAEIIMELGNAPTRFLIRVTGGAAQIDIDSGFSAMAIFRTALQGYSGMMLYGGTRVLDIRRPHPNVIPSIMEIGPLLKHHNPSMVILGIVPRPDKFWLSPWGMVISEEPKLGCITIVNPAQDICLTVQKDVDSAAQYDVEWQYCLKLAKAFIETARHRPFGCALVAYEGGSYTKKEIIAWADLNLPVILVKGSGRITDFFCHDREWLDHHPSVVVCENETEIRQTLISLGGIHE